MRSPLLVAFIFGSIAASPVVAQIVPDTTLPNNAIVSPNGSVFVIDGGTISGANLFHSFLEFSLPTGTAAYFNNAASIDNIITRVTGGNISNIDGLIRANGTANLFLLNPNGIVFGSNAQLNLGGSFFATTAQSVLFSDGLEFHTSGANLGERPLLSASVPVGLQFNNATGTVRVQGEGYELESANDFPRIYEGAGSSEVGLRVAPDRTLALVGNPTVFEGSTITAPGGQIEIGAVQTGRVELRRETSNRWAIEYANVENFGDVRLDRQSLADASGPLSGGIQIRAQNLYIRDGSLLLVQNLGLEPDRAIDLHAENTIAIEGFSSENGESSRVFAQTLTPGRGANVRIAGERLQLKLGGEILMQSLGAGDGGQGEFNVGDLIIEGLPVDDPRTNRNNSGIASIGFGAGSVGDISIDANRVTLERAGNVLSLVFGPTQGGDITVRSSGLVALRGFNLGPQLPTVIASLAQGSGRSGDVTIDTLSLAVEGGGSISTGTNASGNSGQLTISALEKIEIRDDTIGSSATLLDASIREALNLPDITPSGNAGNVSISAPLILLSDGGGFSVRNEGTGSGGTMEIDADRLLLDRQARITATTAFGLGGDAEVNVGNSLQLRNGSQINVEALGGMGDGGNLSINAETIVALENSDIIANSVGGNGGNIDITTQAIFGAEFRPLLTPQSDITASSRLGIDGTVRLNTPDIDSTSGLFRLETETIDASASIIVGCIANNNSFTVTGRGGLPPDPTQPFRGQVIWRDLQDFTSEGFSSDRDERSPGDSDDISISHPAPLTEATTWTIAPDGKIALVSPVPTAATLPQSSCQ